MEKKTFKDIVAGHILYEVNKKEFILEEKIVDSVCGMHSYIIKTINYKYGGWLPVLEGCTAPYLDSIVTITFIYKDEAVEFLTNIIDDKVAQKRREIADINDYIQSLLEKKDNIVTQ